MNAGSQLHIRRRVWPPPYIVVLFLCAIGAAAILGRPRGAEDEPEVAGGPWPEDPERVRGLIDYLNEVSGGLDPPADAQGGVDGQDREPVARGVGLGLYSQDLNYDYGMLIGEIAEHRSGWVSLIYNMYQRDGRSTQMRPATRIEDQERVISGAARAAHAHGLKVLSFPLVLLRNPAEDEWRGNLKPKSLDKWFENYSAHVVRLAALAEREGIEAFSLGSEFSSLEDEEERWGELIREVRAVYSGRLLYSANWDHYEHVPFWRELDAIGLSGYFELTRSLTPTLQALQSAWDYERDRIMDWRAEAGLTQPILFTEVGYANQDGANMYPWDYTRDAPPDPAEQALCYEAFARSWHGRSGFGGVFFYNWFGYDRLDDTGYSPRGKPAAQVMKAWYGFLEGSGSGGQ